MIHRRGRAFDRWDFLILTMFAILGVCLAVATDREYMLTFGQQKSRMTQASRLPDWVKERRQDAIRVVGGVSALLAGWGVGLAWVVLRHRAGRGCPGSFGAGEMAAIIAGLFTLVFAIQRCILMSIEPPSPNGGSLSPARLVPPGPFRRFLSHLEFATTAGYLDAPRRLGHPVRDRSMATSG